MFCWASTQTHTRTPAHTHTQATCMKSTHSYIIHCTLQLDLLYEINWNTRPQIRGVFGHCRLPVGPVQHSEGDWNMLKPTLEPLCQPGPTHRPLCAMTTSSAKRATWLELIYAPHKIQIITITNATRLWVRHKYAGDLQPLACYKMVITHV